MATPISRLYASSACVWWRSNIYGTSPHRFVYFEELTGRSWRPSQEKAVQVEMLIYQSWSDLNYTVATWECVQQEAQLFTNIYFVTCLGRGTIVKVMSGTFITAWLLFWAWRLTTWPLSTSGWMASSCVGPFKLVSVTLFQRLPPRRLQRSLHVAWLCTG